jgi:hypothetical protein
VENLVAVQTFDQELARDVDLLCGFGGSELRVMVNDSDAPAFSHTETLEITGLTTDTLHT